MSPETCFLLYLVQTLKRVTSSWKHWTEICRNYVCVHESIATGSVCRKEDTGGANVGVLRLKHRKRKQTLSLDFDESSSDTKVQILGENMEHRSHFQSLFEARNKGQVFTGMTIEKRKIVDYSSSSDDDEDFNTSTILPISHDSLDSKNLPCRKKLCKVFTGKHLVDLVDVDYDVKGEKTSWQTSRNQQSVEESCTNSSRRSECRTFVRAMAVLIELSRIVSKLVARKMFPFNVQPLVRHLLRCEALYKADSQDVI